MAGKKILVADDSLTIQKVIRLSLTHEGYDIHAVSEGKDAIERIAVIRPDVVLIDVSLPGKSAFEVKREINADEDLKQVSFVLMSGAYEKVDDTQVSELGFHTRLTKPIDPAELRKILSQIVGKSPGRSTPPPSPTPSPSTLHSSDLATPPDFQVSHEDTASHSPPSFLPQVETHELPPSPPETSMPLIPAPLAGAPGEDDLLNDLHLELPPELTLDLGSGELAPLPDLPPPPTHDREKSGLVIDPPTLSPPSLPGTGAEDNWETPVKPQELPPLPQPTSESVKQLWEAQEEKTLSGLILDADLAMNTAISQTSTKDSPPEGASTSHTRPSSTPRHKIEPTAKELRSSPENDEWSVRDAQHSPKESPKSPQFVAENPPILPAALPEELQGVSESLKLSSAGAAGATTHLKLEELLKETPPLPISTEEIESLVQKQIQSAIEKIAQQMLPDIAEKVVKQEIHRLLSEPEAN